MKSRDDSHDLDGARESGRAGARPADTLRHRPQLYQARAARRLGRPGDIVSDAELIALCVAGQQFAWDALIERYQALVFTCAVRAGLGEADASDVVQNVALALYRELGRLRDHSRLSSWLATTARREAWRIARQGQAEITADDPLIVAETTADTDLSKHPEARYAIREDADLVRIGLDHLGDRCRRLLLMLYGDEQAQYADVSQTLSMPIGSIGPTRARCLGQLRKYLERVGF